MDGTPTQASSEAAARTLIHKESRRLTRFHLFTKLPIELQLIIWSFWREDQPVLRHYMVLTRHTRAYAALDFIAGKFVPTAAHSTDSTKDDPLDPMEFKIRFSNSVLTTKGSYDDPLSVILNPSSDVPSDSREVFTRLSPAFAWVNFEKDIFCIENLGHRFGGRFRFLSPNIGAKVPKPLAADHWASRI
ncbi:uncharacterized protein PG998_006699 [Apiospora kogelbergensis]|uniref:uncharacterized protein n=1 Tax=Apiospora kogelbergensis TaxID=1337665 RepID=UPI00312DDF1A